MAMGAKPSPDKPTPPADMSLVLDNERILVVILRSDALLERGKVVDTILGLSSLRNAANQLYLAAPRLLGTSLDAQVFRNYGIGLILFDDRHIEEAVPPSPVPAATPQQPAGGIDTAVLGELVTLKSMYVEMERNISELREQFSLFQEKLETGINTPKPLTTADVLHEQSVFTNSTGQDLPPFFNNNPWLEVLSRRGREDHTFAG